MAAATRYGILIKGGQFLEQSRLLTWLALDKTGTLTHGVPKQTDCIPLGKLDKDRLISLATSLAARSDHPVSKSIAQAAAESGMALVHVEDFTAIPGQGIYGTLAGVKWYLGNQRMLENMGQCSVEHEQQIISFEQQGKTVVILIGEQQGVQGLFAVADTVRSSSIAAIRELKELGVATVMLTGDNERTAEAVAELVAWMTLGPICSLKTSFPLLNSLHSVAVRLAW